MLELLHHSPYRLRLWFISAAAILLLTSILEAGHAHGVFTPEDDHCTLCQHSVALDAPSIALSSFVIPLLLSLTVSRSNTRCITSLTYHFALIRAPPLQHS